VEMSGYLVGIPIPWTHNGTLLREQLREVIHKLVKETCDGLYLFGTSGEGYAASDDEFREIVEIFVETTEDFTGFRQVGCFGLSSDQVKRRCRIVVENGLDSAQITLPFWKELNDLELAKYFEDVCGSFQELSFLLYNNPRNKRRLDGKELEAVHAVNPNLRGAKTGSGAWLDFYELITESPSIQHFVTEPAFLFCRGLGNVGLIPSSNYVSPKKCRAYYDAVVSNSLGSASQLHKEILRFYYTTAVPLVLKGYIDGAIDKAYVRIGGMNMSLDMKSPYLRLSDSDFRWLEKSILALNFIDETETNRDE